MKFFQFKYLKIILYLLVISFILLSFLKCSSSSKFVAPNPLPDDNRSIPQPKYKKINYLKDFFNKQITIQIIQSLDFSRQLRHLFGKPKQAFNTDAFDEVPNSSWFTNRNAYRQMSLKEIAKGPDTGQGPDTTNFWTIKSAKSEGVTPGFQIKDSRGDNYMIKFDPKGYSELATGAEAIATKLFYAMGYNVPENYITYFHPKILKLGDDVEFTDEKGNKRLMTNADIGEIFKKVERLPDGRIRALASKFVESDAIIGGFKYNSTRKDDPNDFVPHQHRRELRALYVPCSWLKHFDTKAGNNLDVYVTENGRSFVKHYLIDFGSTLGSAAHSPQPDYKGHENDFDPCMMFQNIITAGLYVRSWEKLEPFKYSSVGRFDSHDFNPGKTKPNHPNPAFENCTNRDGYWGAKIVMSFTDKQLQTAVAQGQYSDPNAASYLLQILKERRDIIGRYWFNKINPLDRFQISENSPGQQILSFIDLAVESQLESKESTQYCFDLRIGGVLVVDFQDIGNNTRIPIPNTQEQQNFLRKITLNNSNDLQCEIRIKTKRNSNKKWSKWVKVYLHLDKYSGKYSLLGILRQE